MVRSSSCMLILLFLILFGGTTVSYAEPNPSQQVNPEPLLKNIDFQELNHYWQMVVKEYGGYLPELRQSSLQELLKQNPDFSITDWMMGFLKYLFHELIANGKLLGSLIFLTLFITVLQSLQNAFEQTAVSKIAYMIVYLVLIMLALNSFHLAVTYTSDAIDAMGSFIIGLLPLLLGIMATFGHLVSVSFFHPIIIMLIQVSGILISHVVLPLFYLSALLLMTSSLTDKYKVDQLAQLLRNVGLALLGTFLTVFLGVISVQGASTAIQDGVAMKTARFVTGNFVPVIGRLFTDATDTILGASLLLKNTVGLVGVVIIIGLALFPALKVLAIALTFKIAAAILQPIGDGPVVKSMSIISKHILYIFACLLTVTFMFFLLIAILVASSNLTMMVR
ncbi:stage III sporulation protein AE [Thalassobacillus pellis]|uniref:stage III sporulation protein AE n=1 Tax=Thalassobacillus pellis TaxID=748008 RepID=UPI001960EEAA|nr:stage III sporulation protein AE [Thalassobacillus pellis]MBM7552330.1 stage III sporulation protein AE [Thalassobacillus pellis]